MKAKNKALIAFLVKYHPAASVTALMKLSYFVDLISVKKLGSKISNFDYIRYNYGPFTKDIYECVEDLVLEGSIVPNSTFSANGEFVTYKIASTIEPEITYKDIFTQKQLELVREIATDLQGYGAKALTEMAYKTKPMKAIGAKIGGTEGMFKKLNLNAD